MTYHARIQSKLQEAFQPEHLEITDDSASHAGHAGHRAEGETHFSVAIVSHAFAGLSSVARHREVYRVLSSEIKERIHALSLKCITPDEYNHR